MLHTYKIIFKCTCTCFCTIHMCLLPENDFNKVHQGLIPDISALVIFILLVFEIFNLPIFILK